MHLSFNRAKDFAAYWSSSRVANNIHLSLSFCRLRSRHIARFRGHESKVKALTLLSADMCHTEADARLLWTLICNGSRLETIHIYSGHMFIMRHLHWCCYRPPICESLTSIVFVYCKIDERTMAKFAKAMEQASVLTTFQIFTNNVDDADITRLILGNNQLENLFLSRHHLNEVESLALLMAAPKKSWWKLLSLSSYNTMVMDRFKLFRRCLQATSRSSATVTIFDNCNLLGFSECKQLAAVAFHGRVSFA